MVMGYSTPQEQDVRQNEPANAFLHSDTATGGKMVCSTLLYSTVLICLMKRVHQSAEALADCFQVGSLKSTW